MLNNLKNKNIVIPMGLKMNTDFDTYGGALAWSGWVLIYKAKNHETSDLKERFSNFHLVKRPV